MLLEMLLETLDWLIDIFDIELDWLELDNLDDELVDKLELNLEFWLVELFEIVEVEELELDDRLELTMDELELDELEQPSDDWELIRLEFELELAELLFLLWKLWNV